MTYFGMTDLDIYDQIRHEALRQQIYWVWLLKGDAFYVVTPFTGWWPLWGGALYGGAF